MWIRLLPPRMQWQADTSFRNPTNALQILKVGHGILNV